MDTTENEMKPGMKGAAPTGQEITSENHIATEEHDAVEDHHAAEELSGLSKTELLKRMEECVASDPDQVKAIVNKITDLFSVIVKEETENKRRAWEATKEDEDDKFEPAPDPLAEKFETLLRKYHQKKVEQRKHKEAEQRKNLARKLELVEELKALAETSESMHKAFEKLQDIKNRWRETGQVPQASVAELMKNWQYHQDRFYDVVKISKELRELDHKKNQELKTELIAKAEALVREGSVKKALEDLHELHEQWKEIGAAPKEVNDQLWEKFKAASDKIHDRKQEQLANNKIKQEENLKLKLELCKKMEVEAEKTFDSHKAWTNANEAVDALFEEWRKIGHVPKEDEGKTWKQFKDARQKFFRNRETYYAKQREEFKVNYDQKVALCEKAEKLKDSTDWKNTANEFKRLQDEWKKTGPVSRKVSDKIWNRFKSAADAFFDGRNKQFAEADAKLKEHVTLREALIKEASEAELGEDLHAAKEAIHNFQKRWSEMPPAPRNEFGRLEAEWKKAGEKMLEKLKEKGGDENTVKKFKYDQLMQTDRGREQVLRERMNIQDKIKRLQGEINTLETNLGFFGKSKGAQSLVADYQSKVDAAKAEIDKLKTQLKGIPRDERPEPEPETKNFKSKKGFRPRF
ncbi:MAG TPA: DUF349 domain-containing protein [Bacteroidia bacterium]|nr:DUF349 domain-containing protein [Bacteroidia bacterium]